MQIMLTICKYVFALDMLIQDYAWLETVLT